MTDIFNIAATGLLNFQRAISTTSHNISNSTTEGYSKQQVVLGTKDPDFGGGFFLGTGVRINDIDRVVDDIINGQIQTNISLIRENQQFFNETTKVDSLLSDSATSVSATMDEFFSALQVANADPSNVTSRETLLRQTQAMVDRFHAVDRQLNTEISITNSSLNSFVSEINAISESILSINQVITSQVNPSPDSLDHRDRLIKDLAEIVSIRTLEQDNGSVSVTLSNGVSLVSGMSVNRIEAVTSESDSRILDFRLVNASGQSQLLDSSVVTGGQMGGLIRFRDEIIVPAINDLGRLALSIGDTFNQQHRLGMDLGDRIGQDYFNDVNDPNLVANRIFADSDNDGAATFDVEITTVADLTANEYVLTALPSAGYTLENVQTGSVVSFGSFPFTYDGFSITQTGGTMAAGDSYIINPTNNATNAFSAQLNDVNSIALGMPIRTAADGNNAGTATISTGEVLDTTNASFSIPQQLNPPYRVEFLDESNYRILNDASGAVIQAGPVAYNSAIVNEVFPIPAINSIPAQTAGVGTLTANGVGDLIINGIPIIAAAADGVSPAADSAASAIAIANAINNTTTTHGVTARAVTNEVNLGTYTPGTLVAGEFQINGVNIIDASGTQTGLLSSINASLGATGVSAALDNGEIVLTAVDGRNIQLSSAAVVGTANFTNFNIGIINSEVNRAAVVVSDDPGFGLGNMTIAGGNPASVGLVAGVTNQIDPGYRMSISGVPARDDVFTVGYNNGGVSDNRNGAALAGIQSSNIFNGGASTLNGLYSSMVISIGTKAYQAELNEQTANALQANLESRREEVSGVNLDEEAADLLRYEQIYQANARVLQTADQMLSYLFNALG